MGAREMIGAEFDLFGFPSFLFTLLFHNAHLAVCKIVKNASKISV